MSTSDRPEVLICGAGPVGLTLASQLERHGLSFRIIDSNEGRTNLSKALVVWSRSLELLSTGLDVKPICAQGLPVESAEIRAGERVIAHIDLVRDGSPYGTGVMIPQSETERILEEHLAKSQVRVERKTELTAFEDLGDRVRCTLRLPDGSAETIEPNWLVGCDGAHSVVRHGLPVTFHGEVDMHRWYLADVRIAGEMPSATVLVCWHRLGLMVFFQIDKDRWRIVAANELSDPSLPRRDPTLEEMQQLVDERGPSGLRLHDPFWLAEFRINERKVDRYRVGRVFVAGDAAHVHSPAGGQGMNTGMQDAVNLAWKLAMVHRGAGSDSLLESYSVERSGVGDQVLRDTTRVTKLATVRNPIGQEVRNALASLVLRMTGAQERAQRFLSELAIAYPKSPITGRDTRTHHNGGTAPGERLPDAPLRDPGGESTSLMGLLSDPRVQILLFDEDDPEQTASKLREAVPAKWRQHVRIVAVAEKPVSSADVTWRDEGEAAANELGFHQPGFAVVRPDGYVALYADATDTDSLRDWLGRL